MKSIAVIGWEVDVEAETDRLIELGEAPWAAAEQAVRNVRRKRRERAAKRASEQFMDAAEDAQIRAGYADYLAGRFRPIEEFMAELEPVE